MVARAQNSTVGSYKMPFSLFLHLCEAPARFGLAKLGLN
jgi:hypothetical protein